jgi:hypothetical protein
MSWGRTDLFILGRPFPVVGLCVSAHIFDHQLTRPQRLGQPVKHALHACETPKLWVNHCARFSGFAGLLDFFTWAKRLVLVFDQPTKIGTHEPTRVIYFGSGVIRLPEWKDLEL